MVHTIVPYTIVLLWHTITSSFDFDIVLRDVTDIHFHSSCQKKSCSLTEKILTKLNLSFSHAALIDRIKSKFGLIAFRENCDFLIFTDFWAKDVNVQKIRASAYHDYIILRSVIYPRSEIILIKQHSESYDCFDVHSNCTRVTTVRHINMSANESSMRQTIDSRMLAEHYGDVDYSNNSQFSYVSTSSGVLARIITSFDLNLRILVIPELTQPCELHVR